MQMKLNAGVLAAAVLILGALWLVVTRPSPKPPPLRLGQEIIRFDGRSETAPANRTPNHGSRYPDVTTTVPAPMRIRLVDPPMPEPWDPKMPQSRYRRFE